MLDGTRKFSLVDESNKEMKRTLTAVYDALKEKGYNPVSYTHLIGCVAPAAQPGFQHHNVAALFREIPEPQCGGELKFADRFPSRQRCV